MPSQHILRGIALAQVASFHTNVAWLVEQNAPPGEPQLQSADGMYACAHALAAPPAQYICQRQARASLGRSGYGLGELFGYDTLAATRTPGLDIYRSGIRIHMLVAFKTSAETQKKYICLGSQYTKAYRCWSSVPIYELLVSSQM